MLFRKQVVDAKDAKPVIEVKEVKDVKSTEDTYKNTISSVEHWKNLQKRLDQFNTLEIKASNLEDEVLYQKLHIKYIEKIKNGLRSEEYNFLCKPFVVGVAVGNNFKDESEYFRTLFNPHGIKSLAFIELLFLPYFMDSQHVRYTSQYPAAQKVIDFFSSPGSYIYTGGIIYDFEAKKLLEAVNYFKERNPTLAKQLSGMSKNILPMIDVINLSNAVTDKINKSSAP